MERPVKHLSLHRVNGTELRVIADVEAGVLPLIEAEETVIRRYAAGDAWPHRWVNLFVLQDLEPLRRQLRSTAGLPADGAADLDGRPVVNIYDLADSTGCNVYVDQQGMATGRYWDDPLALQGLLAHEHGHPLGENATTRSSRRLQIQLSLEQRSRQMGATWPVRQERLQRRLTSLATMLCLLAPREVFTDEVAIRAGFGNALFHVCQRDVESAQRHLPERDDLQRRLRDEVSAGQLRAEEAEQLLLVGSLDLYVKLALEVAPFQRMKREAEAQELESLLQAAIFPSLEPAIAVTYAALCKHYALLGGKMTPLQLKSWGESIVSLLARALADKGLHLHHRLWIAT